MLQKVLQEKTTSPRPGRNAFRAAVAPFEEPIPSRSIRQIINSVVPYAALWVLMILTLDISIWLTLLLAIPAAGFLVRIFIITHDCGHGSFLASKRLNSIIGYVTGTLTFTPYAYWTHRHAIHHATAGNLDRRGTGDMWTMTLQEYREASWWLRFRYRLVRNPIVFLIIGPMYVFLILNRFAAPDDGWRWHRSVLWSNLGLFAMAGGMSALIGWQAYLMIQLPIILLAGIGGVWLFYVQHQYEDGYWERTEEWDYYTAAIEGSSYYRLPRVLQWFSGNIGFHHVHHLSPRIPNYRLQECHERNPLLHRVRELTLLQSLRCLRLTVWDADRKKLVPLGLF